MVAGPVFTADSAASVHEVPLAFLLAAAESGRPEEHWDPGGAWAPAEAGAGLYLWDEEPDRNRSPGPSVLALVPENGRWRAAAISVHGSRPAVQVRELGLLTSAQAHRRAREAAKSGRLSGRLIAASRSTPGGLDVLVRRALDCRAPVLAAVGAVPDGGPDGLDEFQAAGPVMAGPHRTAPDPFGSMEPAPEALHRAVTARCLPCGLAHPAFPPVPARAERIRRTLPSGLAGWRPRSPYSLAGARSHMPDSGPPALKPR